VKPSLALLVLSSLSLPAAVASGQAAPPVVRPPASAVQLAMQNDPRGTAEAQARTRQRLLDLQLAQLVNQRLIEAGLTDLVVTCHDGRIELRGATAGDELRQRAGELALSVRGVVGVDNALLVPGEAAPAPAPAPIIEPAAADGAEPIPGSSTAPFGFATRDGLAGRDIVVEMIGGVARVRGEVNNDASRTYVAIAAQSVPGVCAVRNQVVVHKATLEESRRLALIVQHQFEYDPFVQGIAPMVLVKVGDGIVRLEGRVQDDFQRQRAENLAALQVGVFAVDNRLEIDEELRLQATRRGPLTVVRMR
jgi:osmotically-inducible protein OsmY